MSDVEELRRKFETIALKYFPVTMWGGVTPEFPARDTSATNRQKCEQAITEAYEAGAAVSAQQEGGLGRCDYPHRNPAFIGTLGTPHRRGKKCTNWTPVRAQEKK